MSILLALFSGCILGYIIALCLKCGRLDEMDIIVKDDAKTMHVYNLGVLVNEMVERHDNGQIPIKCFCVSSADLRFKRSEVLITYGDEALNRVLNK